MWTLLVLCSVIASCGAQDAGRSPTTEGANTEQPKSKELNARYYWTTEGQRSCRYNCGYDLGSCSCSSSCQYYGNCCYDYNYYCPSSTPSYPTTERPQEATTEGYHSCQYNCGYNLGSCSCSSSCQYYGNCCYDYNYYCPSSTPSYPTTERPQEATTEGYHSCQYNCGYNLGSCSCSSSCQYYGNCCYDYNYYCPSSTPSYPTTRTPQTPTTTACGGYLYGSSGIFNSPNYPNKYPNSADCIWYIRPGSRIVRLDFPFVETECNFDFIYIYDGSSTSSRLLGRVCGFNSTTFYSTGPYLTVRFMSDGSVNYGGFQANYQVVSGGSCRYNCGYQVGNCSCYTNCEWYGNCCADYQDYCSPTTPSYTRPPTITTAVQRSCRYNCGYNLGSCSCTSSCQYYGNCCHDYSWYCPTSTVDPYTTNQPSCRNNCGYNMGSCSCSSSCQYYGNCCYDYYSYCPSSTQSTIRPTTDQPSCRYNCGYNMGSCSCSSSCQYYGNCCYDYYSYCPSSTQSPIRPTTDQPSCRNNCGRHLGSCSCSSSCQYNGNCCYDYYSYCSYTTGVSGTETPCGGSLFGSGEISSPNHPNYYYDNAYCVWQLRASYDQRIYLAFTFLQLENCCNCDYISVYDGPSVNSRPLGKVCNDSLISFFSSSNYMTVLFRTDSSVVGRGFKAEFTSSLQPSSGRVDCSSDNMNIVIQRSYLNSLGYDGHSLYVNDQYCRPQVSHYQVVFSFPINTCGTVRKFENGKVVYTNTLRAYTSNYGEITRQAHLKMNVACRMEQDSVSQIMYVAQQHDNSSIAGSGRFNTSMAFYTSSSFYYKVTHVPYEVSLNQNLYVQVDLRRGDSSLVLYLDTCVASPSPHDFQSRSYDLVRNGCPVDSTYRVYTTGTRPYARFTFKAFKFLRATEAVYIQCKVLICQASDTNSRCRQRCNRRKVRDLGSEHDSETLVLGPIKLKDPKKKEEGAHKEEKV